MKLLLTTLLLSLTLSLRCPNDQKCAACQNTECKMCYQSYLNLGKCITPSKPVENCLRYESNGVCDVCYHGYTPSQNGLCVLIGIKDCLFVNNNQCKLCKRKILVQNGACGEEKCKTVDCAFCTLNENGQEICDQCDKGFALVNDGGMKCVEEGENKDCMLIGADGKCTLCDVNFYSSEGKCLKSGEMKVEMISDLGFLDKMGNKIRGLLGFVEGFAVLSLGTALVGIFA